MSTPIPEEVMRAAMELAVEMEIHAAVSTTTKAKAEVIALALLARDERAAKIAERDADWTAFQRHSKKDWKTGDEKNVFAPPSEPDDTMPTDFNVFAYRMGIAAGRTIASAIRDRSKT